MNTLQELILEAVSKMKKADMSSIIEYFDYKNNVRYMDSEILPELESLVNQNKIKKDSGYYVPINNQAGKF